MNDLPTDAACRHLPLTPPFALSPPVLLSAACAILVVLALNACTDSAGPLEHGDVELDTQPDVSQQDTQPTSPDTFPECAVNVDCDDGNPCTIDVCVAGLCGRGNAPNGIPCDDGLTCTTDDECENGICEGIYDDTCDLLRPCKSHNDCLRFDDGNVCNGRYACVDDKCHYDPSEIVCPTPTMQCLTALCDPTSGACNTMPVSDGTDCDDNNPCTGGATEKDVCVDGACHPGQWVCDCQSDHDCAHLGNSDLCAGQYLCVDASCIVDSTSIVECPLRLGPCIDYECVPSTGECVAVPNNAVCDDGNPCTLDHCADNGECQHDSSTPTALCDDQNPCTIDRCDHDTGTCLHDASQADAACDDHNLCTVDRCDPATGTCIHDDTEAAAACSSDTCHAPQWCNPGTGMCTTNPCASFNCADGETCIDGHCRVCSTACDGFAGVLAGGGLSRAARMVPWPGGGFLVSGQFAGTVDFDPSEFGVVTRTSRGLADAYVAKFDAQMTLTWVATWGGSQGDNIEGLAVDSGGRILVSGWTNRVDANAEVDLDPSDAVYPRPIRGTSDGYLLVMDQAGTLVWARTWGNDGDVTRAHGLAIDASDNVYVTGHRGATAKTIFDGTGDGQGTGSVYIVSYDRNGQFRWVRTFGSANATADDIAVAADGSLLLTGYALQHGDWDPGPETSMWDTGAGEDAFVMRMSPNGDFRWIRWISGPGYSDRGFAVLPGPCGSVIAAGIFTGAVDFDDGPGTKTVIATGDYDSWLTRWDESGQLEWVRTWSETEGKSMAGTLAMDNEGLIVVGGYFVGAVAFEPLDSRSVFNVGSNNEAGYVAAFTVDGTWTWAAIAGANHTQVQSLAASPDGALWIGGSYLGEIDLDPGQGILSFTATPGSQWDAFLWRLGHRGTFVRTTAGE